MDTHEKSILFNLGDAMKASVDPMTLVSYLSRHGYATRYLHETVRTMFRSGRSRADIMGHVLLILPQVINLHVLVSALDRLGYKPLASEMFFLSRGSYTELGGERVPKSDTGNRTQLQLLYRNLKRMVHDSQFKNPRQALRMLGRRFKSEFQMEKDELKRQKLADKCVAILGVELDAHYDSLSCRVEITQDEMLEEMQELIPMTTNPLVSDTVVYSRRANLDAFRGDFNHAANMLIAARNSAQGFHQGLELVNLLYIEVYVKLWEFESTPTRDIADTLMMWGRFGLESLNQESEETRRMWKRMFILRMVFALLGLGNRGNVVKGYNVERSDLREAQDLLADIDKIWDRIEVRREMFYCIARARLNELFGWLDDAKGYLERAKSMAIQGGFLEKITFIDESLAIIDTKMNIPCTECATKLPAETQDSLGKCDRIYARSNTKVGIENEHELQLLTYRNETVTRHDTNTGTVPGNIIQRDNKAFQAIEDEYQLIQNTQSIDKLRITELKENPIGSTNDIDDTDLKVVLSRYSSLKDITSISSDQLNANSSDYKLNNLKTKCYSPEMMSFSPHSVMCEETRPKIPSSPISTVAAGHYTTEQRKTVNETHREYHDCKNNSAESGFASVEKKPLCGVGLRSEFNKIFGEKLEFGSVALYEDRGEPEGLSATPVQVLQKLADESTSVHSKGQSLVDNSALDIEDDVIDDDDALFG